MNPKINIWDKKNIDVLYDRLCDSWDYKISDDDKGLKECWFSCTIMNNY